MRSRFPLALGGCVLSVMACGGSPFTGGGGEAGTSSGGSDAGAGSSAGTEPAGGATSKAGAGGKAGSSGRAGSGGAGGSIGVAGDVSVGGDVSIGGTEPGVAGTGMGVSCMEPDDCDVSSLCKKPTCNGNVCGEQNAPDGPITLQVPSDCKQARCQGGKEMLVVDEKDNDDQVECTADSCDMNGKPVHTVRTGEACGIGDQCTDQATCVDCVDNGGCDEASVCGPNNTCIPF